MDKKNAPIGVFDSGVGGISVLKTMTVLLPHEDFIYYADSAHAPYGTKTAAEVQRLSLDITKRRLSRGAKAIVVACNTATSVSISMLRKEFSTLPIIGIEPALKPAALSLPHPRILVLATPMTIREEKFHDLFVRFDTEAEISALPCPELVELVEAGKLQGSEVDQVLFDKLSPFDGSVDAVVLGCTHYPFLKEAIRRVFRHEVTLYDGALGTAKELRNRLAQRELLTNRTANGKVVMENSLGEAEAALSEKLYSLFSPDME